VLGDLVVLSESQLKANTPKAQHMQIARQITNLIRSLLFVVRIQISLTFKKCIRLVSKKSDLIEFPNDFDTASGLKIAVLAMYPSEDGLYQKSILNLINGFDSNGVQVVAVSNRAIPTGLQNELEIRGCKVIIRKNQGRDFGAYKAGIRWLTDLNLINVIERLFLVNDTLIWMESSSEIVHECGKHIWSSMFLNFEIHTHAQSFFLSFSKEVISNDEFQKFWERYVPLNYRRHAIRNGEVKLTSTLINQGFLCKPYVNSGLVEKITDKAMTNAVLYNYVGSTRLGRAVWTDIFAVQESQSMEESLQDFRGIHNLKSEMKFTDDEIRLQVIRSIGKYCYMQAPHRIGLHLFLLFGLPLKTDLYKCFPISEITRCVKLKNPEYAPLVEDFFTHKSQIFMSDSGSTRRKRMLGEI
jgi:hypothetical protein